MITYKPVSKKPSAVHYVDAYDCLNMVPGNPENLYLMELIEKNLAIQNQKRKIN
jgi:hypothetical protein